MQIRLGLTLAAMLVAALSVLSVACGGDGGSDSVTRLEPTGDPLSSNEYFAELQALFADYKTASNASVDALSSAQDLEGLKAAFGALPPSLEAFVEGWASLAPPLDAAGAHATGYDAAEAFLKKLNEVNADIQAAESLEEFINVAGNQDLADLNIAFNDACPNLQEIATADGVAVTLACP